MEKCEPKSQLSYLRKGNRLLSITGWEQSGFCNSLSGDWYATPLIYETVDSAQRAPPNYVLGWNSPLCDYWLQFPELITWVSLSLDLTYVIKSFNRLCVFFMGQPLKSLSCVCVHRCILCHSEIKIYTYYKTVFHLSPFFFTSKEFQVLIYS